MWTEIPKMYVQSNKTLESCKLVEIFEKGSFCLTSVQLKSILDLLNHLTLVVEKRAQSKERGLLHNSFMYIKQL